MGLLRFGKYSDRAISKAATDLGLRPALPREKYGDYAAIKFDVDYMPEESRLSEFESAVRKAWDSKVVLPSGRRLYSAMLDWVHVDAADETDEIAGYLAPFKAEFDRNPTPFMAGVYAEALHSAAFVLRGTRWVNKTSATQFEGMQKLQAMAHGVLERVPANDEYAWWSARYSLALSDGTSTIDRDQIGEKLVSLDPDNVATFGAIAHQALPRWHGTNAGDIERIAHMAVESTHGLLGKGAYGIVHWGLTANGSYEVGHTAIDLEYAEESFRDLYERFPTVPVLNMFARTMSWAGNESVVKELFDGGLRSIDAVVWDGDDEADGIELAARAYLWAKNNQ